MTTPVSLLPATTYDAPALNTALETLLAPLGGIEAFVKPGDRVLLKPNLLTASRPGKECITRPELVAAVAQLVKGAGGKPFMGDSPAFGSARGVRLLQINATFPLGSPANHCKGSRFIAS